MCNFTDSIDNQIAFNQAKNFFFDRLDIFQFNSGTIKAISEIYLLNPDSREFLIDYTTDKAIEEFYRINQYFSIDSAAKNDLRNIYSVLFDRLKSQPASYEEISKNHYEKLRSWIKQSNPFAEKIFKFTDKKVEPVACSEYSPDLQLRILKLNPEELMQPVLDIGCGSQAQMVKYLERAGIKVTGIDRVNFAEKNLQTADWLEYDYGNRKWGTIISNLGFSNHFRHHNMRNDGNYIEYGKTYMSILNSLEMGGCFHYVPDLPFIEKYLDAKHFELRKFELNEYGFKTSIIKRIE